MGSPLKGRTLAAAKPITITFTIRGNVGDVSNLNFNSDLLNTITNLFFYKNLVQIF